MTFDIGTLVFNATTRNHTRAYWVGGPVRDRLLSRPCHDWDLVCRDALKVARTAARKAHAKFITLDDVNRIYRVILSDHTTIDFAELQGRSIEEDLARRDFTINAMAVPVSSSQLAVNSRLQTANCELPTVNGELLIDPFGGQRDLKRRIIRAVSGRAFAEDPLRLLRAFRFAAQFGFVIESKTRRWIVREAHRLPARVAQERIREEWMRLLQQPASALTLRDMDRMGLLTALFPDLETCRRVAHRYYGAGGVLKHSLDTVQNFEWIVRRLGSEGGGVGGREASTNFIPLPQAVLSPIRDYLSDKIGGFRREVWLKFAALLHDIGKPATAKVIGKRLRFFGHEDVGATLSRRITHVLRCSRMETHLMALWVQNHMRLGNLAAAPKVTEKAAARFFRDLGEEGVGMLLVSLADHYGYLAKRQWGEGRDPVEKTTAFLLESFYSRREKVLPTRLVNGHILMKKLRLKPSPLIGVLLAKIQDAQVEGKVKTAEEAVAYAKKQVKRQKIKVKNIKAKGKKGGVR